MSDNPESRTNGNTSLAIHIDPKVFCLTDPEPECLKPSWKRVPRWGWILFSIVVCIILYLKAMDVFVFQERFLGRSEVSFCGKLLQTSYSNPWPLVALFMGFLSAIVALCGIGCRHAFRMEKIAAEERKQRFDMRKFLVEKSIDHAEKQAKGAENNNKNDGNDSKYSVSIVVNK